jgi:putative oxidoreductase
MQANLGRSTHALLRIGAGLLFVEHGLQKLFGMLGGLGPDGGVAPLMSLMGAAGVLEFAGGLLIVTGLLTRPMAVLLFLEMMVAFYLSHWPQGGWPVQNGGELALLYGTIFLFLAGNGAGPLSVDQWMLDALRGDRRQMPFDRRHPHRVAA